jgi:hypothetical protein
MDLVVAMAAARPPVMPVAPSEMPVHQVDGVDDGMVRNRLGMPFATISISFYFRLGPRRPLLLTRPRVLSFPFKRWRSFQFSGSSSKPLLPCLGWWSVHHRAQRQRIILIARRPLSEHSNLLADEKAVVAMTGLELADRFDELE